MRSNEILEAWLFILGSTKGLSSTIYSKNIAQRHFNPFKNYQKSKNQ